MSRYEDRPGKPRVRLTLLVLLWIWAACIFLLVDLFFNVYAFDSVRPRSSLYRGMRRAAHAMVGEPYGQDVRAPGLLPSARVIETLHPNGAFRSRREVITVADGRDLDHGTWTVWSEEGRKLVQCEFRWGTPHGTVAIWHENGRLAARGEIPHGKRGGTWMQWDESGNRIRERTLVAGVTSRNGSGNHD